MVAKSSISNWRRTPVLGARVAAWNQQAETASPSSQPVANTHALVARLHHKFPCVDIVATWSDTSPTFPLTREAV